MKRVAILQSNYIPWKGYFDLIASVDELIVYDDMQFTKGDWRNRNLIKTPQGVKWITVPVKTSGKYFQSINETEIGNIKWREVHLKSLHANYKKCTYFGDIYGRLEERYFTDFRYISELNLSLIFFICEFLEIETKISLSSDYHLQAGKTERLVDLCHQVGASEYLSGPAARGYIEPKLFAESGIELKWMDYAGYPIYPQKWGEFVHGVTILDLLFNCGKDARKYMRLGGVL